MARPIRSIDIYLPLDFNDGRPIPEANYVSLQQELLNRFGGVTSVQRQLPLQGLQELRGPGYLHTRRANGSQFMTWSDPIVDEVRRVRDAYAARFEYDLRAIFRDLKELEKRSGRKFVAAPIEHGVVGVSLAESVDAEHANSPQPAEAAHE